MKWLILTLRANRWLLLGSGFQILALGFPAQLDGFFSYGQPVWWLSWIACAIFFHHIKTSQTRKEAFWLGWGFWTTYLAFSLDWLYTAMHVYGEMPAAIALLLVVVLSALLALYHATACAVYFQLKSKNILTQALLFSALITMAELARGTWLTGFGWANPAYTQITGPLAVYASWGGVYTIDFLLFFCSSVLASLIYQIWSLRLASLKLNKAAASGLILIAGLMGLGFGQPLALFSFSKPNPLENGKPLSVELLQGNIAQSQKFDEEGTLFALKWYRQKMFESTASLVIAPETAIPLLPDDLPPFYWSDLRHHFSIENKAALIGSPWGSVESRYQNALVGLKPEQASPYLYFKYHLVPFGEYVPKMFKWVVDLMNIPLGNFQAGKLIQPSFLWHGEKMAPTICFEILFGEEMAERFNDKNDMPTMFINVSNLAWFGDSRALYQELSIARMRALEFQRPILQANNTGVTAVIDKNGAIQDMLPLNYRGGLSAKVEGQEGVTPYAYWVVRVGVGAIWFILIFIVLSVDLCTTP